MMRRPISCTPHASNGGSAITACGPPESLRRNATRRRTATDIHVLTSGSAPARCAGYIDSAMRAARLRRSECNYT